MLCKQSDSVLESHDISLVRIVTDRGTEYCGKPEYHAYQLYLGIENIDHSKTKAYSPQTNGICERFHKTMLSGESAITFYSTRSSIALWKNFNLI